MDDEKGTVSLQEPLELLAREPSDFVHDLRFPPVERIRVYDDTLRDGEQMPGVAFSPRVKFDIARMLSDIGVHTLDVGFPAVAPGEQETLRLVLEGRRRGELRDDLEIVTMNRASTRDLDTTIRTIDQVGLSPDAITYLVFSSGSDLHVKYKLGRSLLHREGRPQRDWLALPLSWYRAANIRLCPDAIAYLRSQGGVDYLIELHRAVVAAGVTRVVVADTVGCYSPYAVREQISRLRAGTPDVRLGVHFHNDLGVAAWNTITGLGSGADYFMTSINGIGERAGNAPMHQVLMQLLYLFGIELPGIRYDRLRDLALYMERVSGIPVQPTEPGIGRNVFSHESGIHTAGMLIHPRIYQFIPPRDLGAEVRYVYGKHSGALVVEHALRRAGLDHSPEVVAMVMAEVKRIREERAQHEDFRDFQRGYDRHLDGLGLSIGEVAELGRALTEPPELTAYAS